MSNHYLNPGEFEQLLAKVEGLYGEVSLTQLKTAIDVIEDFLSVFSRVFAVRVDLHFPQMVSADAPDMPTCFPRTDPKAITRFFASLSSQLLVEHHRKGKRGTPAPFGYIWVREQNASDFPHYHLVLLFNKDDYAYLGNYSDFEMVNMAIRIQKAWCSALRLPFPEHARLVHFPDGGAYWLGRQTATMDCVAYREFLLRTAYLFKLHSKVSGERNFGRSLPIGKAGV
ncbi:inovirus Gp2 family protein [Aeromonas veronii]|uniref:inovirus Gp2 family protein n=1 Tax=Aeromonas veronii TaxID=654 RepID=UPI0011167D54|nr:inovirus Gp2 family protein [Aeromonas veronii]HDO1314112.1 inovirus Gp2 family protein [Aeromonas veronii]HDO1331686.1 inovirus Gp2 family protein [Aeromonas veronii]HDO1336233.1 inovirus Gp2 family protein [Aeromonas veronii]HDO1340749.1 inovirus Gp2 family protein [Aeromonas veronii]HDO1345281.1 inovirus Gp2 family protein [Aeromonas veronii]